MQKVTDTSNTAREGMPRVILDAICVLTFSALVMLSINTALAEAIPDVLAKKLAEFKGAERGQIIPIQDESLIREFPQYSFYVMRFRQYPVALAPPEPLGSNNLFIVKPDGAVEHMRDSETLKKFFRGTLAPVTTEAKARNTVKVWLQLAQELYQDGFFQFSIPEESIRVTLMQNGGLGLRPSSWRVFTEI